MLEATHNTETHTHVTMDVKPDKVPRPDCAIATPVWSKSEGSFRVIGLGGRSLSFFLLPVRGRIKIKKRHIVSGAVTYGTRKLTASVNKGL
jgi:hypothetical protein